MKNMTKTSICIFIFSILALGCSKISSDVENQDFEKYLADPGMAIQGIPSPSFNWETANLMPMPASSYSVTVPWGSGASRKFSADILSDYKSQDGWALLYNTFNTSQLPDHLYFVLYNKFRGLIRIYYYVQPGNYITSANIVHALESHGSHSTSSPLLNFAGQSNYIDLNINQTFASMLEDQQVAPSTWYAFQYELAYDATTPNQSYQNFNLRWPIKSNQISQISINGTIQSNVPNGISTPSINLTVNPTVNGQFQYPIYGPGSASNVPNGSDVWNKIIQIVAGGVVDVLKGIFGGSSGSTPPPVHYFINANVNLSGTITSDFSLGAIGMAVPGYNQSQTPGYEPIYNQPLGVFYLSNKPTIKRTRYTIYDGPTRPEMHIRFEYTLEDDFEIVFNPNVLSEATISNIRKHIVVQGGGPLTLGTEESIGRTGSEILMENAGGTLSGLRIAFDVTPNNGSPKVTIVKSFLVNTINENITIYN